MNLKIDGSYVNGTDIGHPDGQDIFYACCCGSIAGSTPEEREYYARLMVAAPEMYELISDLSQAYDDNQSSHELASRLYDLRCRALRLLAKIEGGEECKSGAKKLHNGWNR